MKCLLMILTFLITTFLLPPETIHADDPLEQLKETIRKSSYAKDSIDEIFAEYLKATIPSHKQELILTMVIRKNEVLLYIINKLESGTEGEKIRIVKLIESTLWKETGPTFEKILKNDSESEMVRIGAAYILGKLGDPKVAPALRDALQKARSKEEKKATIIGLGFLRDKDSADLLRTFLNDKDKLVSVYAAMALGELGHPDGLNLVMDATYDEDWKVRREAIYAIGSIGSKDAIKRLEVLAETEKFSSLRAESKIALHRINLRTLPKELALSYLEKRLRDLDLESRMWAVQTLSLDYGNEGLIVLEKKAHEKSEVGGAAAYYYLKAKPRLIFEK